ncbi:MAG: AraC family transcriptional regulator [Thermomicrobiales bacterium]|nr:AraC family transcriptional regulator [Thermomicrobiales bacterium]MCO5227477.1 AraC family transcriptional regulator [Thermomicrobiales bacterium]
MENMRLRDTRSKLADQIRLRLPEDGNAEITNGVYAFRRSDTSDFFHGESRLALCLIVQGAKEVMVGEQVYHYDPDHYLITAAELPTISRVVEASPDQPYLAIACGLDPALVRSVLMSAPMMQMNLDENDNALKVQETEASIVDAVLRLMIAAENPQDAEFLIPMIMKEIIYRLLCNDHGARLARIAGTHPTSARITRALDTLRTQYDQPFSVPDIAEDLGMSVSSFHDHFKRATGLTPLQFQKHVRLREARRILLTEDIDIATAGYQVGYRDASHFNRDYKRMFGASPSRDIDQLRAAGPLATATN